MAVSEDTVRRVRSLAAAALVLCIHARASAAPPLQWAGRTWNITTGGMAGVAEGSASNVSVDASGYLHLKISKNGDTWTAAEVFTTDKLGFGSYQWHIDAPIDRFDQNVVLGLYPYGPAAGIGSDGTNEIDIEYSFWGDPNGVNGDFTDYPASGKTIGEKSYTFSLNGGTLSTSRFIWSASQIESSLFTGITALGSTTGLLESWTYAPSNATVNIPQQALPLGMNLWCFDSPPSDGKDVEVVIRDFQFVPEGTDAGGAGGTAGASGGASAGGANAGSTNAGSASAGAPAAGGGSEAATGGQSANGTAGASPGASSGHGNDSAGSAGSSTSNGGTDEIHAGGESAGTPSAAANADQNSGCNVRAASPRGGLGWFALASVLAVGVRRFGRRNSL